MLAVLWLIDTVVTLFIWAIVVSVVLSWLVVFGVINTQNRFVYLVGDFLQRVTEPVLGPLRRVLPNLGGVDISPLVAILLLIFARRLLFELFV